MNFCCELIWLCFYEAFLKVYWFGEKSLLRMTKFCEAMYHNQATISELIGPWEILKDILGT